jgi:effector-binding domain-containing protein
MTPRPLRLLALLGLLGTAACIAPANTDGDPGEPPPQQPAFQPDLPVSRAPFTTVHCEWKQRLDQPYVYVEHRGSYTETGRLLNQALEAMAAQGLEPSGPPFGLFYDDPGRVPVAELRSRACIPVGGRVTAAAPLAFDVLPSTTVVYAFAAGAYPEVPRAYPGLFAYMAQRGWVEDGPAREIYLVAPGSVSDYGELITELQVPVRFGE